MYASRFSGKGVLQSHRLRRWAPSSPFVATRLLSTRHSHVSTALLFFGNARGGLRTLFRLAEALAASCCISSLGMAAMIRTQHRALSTIGDWDCGSIDL